MSIVVVICEKNKISIGSHLSNAGSQMNELLEGSKRKPGIISKVDEQKDKGKTYATCLRNKFVIAACFVF